MWGDYRTKNREKKGMETSGQKLINELTCVMSGPPLDPYLNKLIIKKRFVRQ